MFDKIIKFYLKSELMRCTINISKISKIFLSTQKISPANTICPCCYQLHILRKRLRFIPITFLSTHNTHTPLIASPTAATLAAISVRQSLLDHKNWHPIHKQIVKSLCARRTSTNYIYSPLPPPQPLTLAHTFIVCTYVYVFLANLTQTGVAATIKPSRTTTIAPAVVGKSFSAAARTA